MKHIICCLMLIANLQLVFAKKNIQIKYPSSKESVTKINFNNNKSKSFYNPFSILNPVGLLLKWGWFRGLVLDDYILFCKMNRQFIIQASDYDLVRTIKDCEKNFRAKNHIE